MTFMAGVPISVRIEKPLMSSSSLKSIHESPAGEGGGSVLWRIMRAVRYRLRRT